MLNLVFRVLHITIALFRKSGGEVNSLVCEVLMDQRTLLFFEFVFQI